jgi:hypothetical protein
VSKKKFGSLSIGGDPVRAVAEGDEIAGTEQVDGHERPPIPLAPLDPRTPKRSQS